MLHMSPSDKAGGEREKVVSFTLGSYSLLLLAHTVLIGYLCGPHMPSFTCLPPVTIGIQQLGIKSNQAFKPQVAHLSIAIQLTDWDPPVYCVGLSGWSSQQTPTHALFQRQLEYSL